MKHLLIYIFFISINASAQDVDILLIGVSHDYSKYPIQDYSNLYNKIRKFKPDAFFGEFLSKEDERLVMDYWCKQDNIKRLKMLRSYRNLSDELLSKSIDSLKKITLLKPKDYYIKADLAHAYYLNQDVANGHYQFWQVFDYLKQKPDAKLENYVIKLLSPQLDTTGRSMKRLKTSEYALIAFPMMLEMGIRDLLSMDCQDYDLNWQASWVAFDAKFSIFRNDTTTSFVKQLKANLATINKGFEKYESIEKTSQNVTEWLNTDEASAISASGDFYLPVMYDMKGFPKEEMLSKIHWWIMRNQGMCDNVVNRARMMGAKKVIVIAGANHRKYMQDIFKAMPHVRVRNINEVD
ncbi:MULTISPECIES: DUF5694 domain-containing protein [unclassified Arcicella]|uniref:DUF5694 domain-containing protein n=1 Tax=unclassified Arcicella TaxID=2644986 RepID=UPI002863A5C6|nr:MULTISPECIES: DUF5694 domain-containing protein [unclassified Arcicella]MDR6561783.1 hypothetical protein [Arcicella sp. BE51]MDR6812563.1 hypothetical protein [Arcicella sp. BE140]MDR6823665.1 hypothetical protein [Arcicella sp. BE139]